MLPLQAFLEKLKVECDEKGPLRSALTRKSTATSKKSVFHGPGVHGPAGLIRFSDPDDIQGVFDICTEPMLKTFRIDSPADILYLIKNSVMCITHVESSNNIIGFLSAREYPLIPSVHPSRWEDYVWTKYNENSVMCITHLDPSNNIIGFLSAREYPLIPSVHPNSWEEYVWTKYKAIELKPRNTLWLHLLCWDIKFGKELVNALLKTVFMHDPYVQHIAFIKTAKGCAQLAPGASRTESAFRPAVAMERGISGDKLPPLLIADRPVVSPRLKVRRAVEEDNDDILPIIAAHSRRLREMYGDYYISELIQYPTDDREVLVCEHKEVAVGVMVLNSAINFEALEECFDLSPFAGLRHLDQVPHKHRSRDWGENLSFSEVNAEGDGSYEEGISEDHKNNDNKGSVQQEDSVVDAPVQHYVKMSSVLYDMDEFRPLASASMMEYIDILADEEEEMDYDIVNIDPELLKLPELIVKSDESVTKNVIDYVNRDNAGFQEILKPKKEKRKSFVDSSTLALHGRPNDYILRYSGESNAFLLEVFAMHSDYDERYGFDMLEVAFELFPDKDYCIMCLPSKMAVFPLLGHFTLVAPHTTMNKRFINDSLFVSHINSVRGEISARPAEPADLGSLFNLLEHASRKNVLAELIETSLSSLTIQSYMLLVESQPIGVAVVGPLEEGTIIRNMFDLLAEPRRPGTDGVILGGVMSPIVDMHGRWYLREVMRMSRFSTLFWICQPFAKGDQSAKRNMMSLTERMVPVKPRKHLPNLSRDPNQDRLFKNSLIPISVWMIERPITSLPMVYVTTGIVVVGASRTGLSFIEALVLGPSARYLTFTNVTLISEHGIPTVAECLKAADICVPNEGRYTDSYLKTVPFCVYIDVIPAVVTAIDRTQKRVQLSSGGYKYYDELVLTCGLQFQHPDYLKEPLERAKEVVKGKLCDRILMDDPSYQPDRVPPPPELPSNLFVINSLLQANLVLRRLLKMISDFREQLNSDNPIVVYGECLETYCCISALLELGVRPSEIGFIENFPTDDPATLRVNCFNDEYVDERVQDKLQDLGIRVMRNFRLVKAYKYQNKVTSLCLMDPLHSVTLNCFALFYYGQKAINIEAFRAINECGLVYDGGLIVNSDFETNDPAIFGAGSCCNYSRRLYSSRWNHKYYNSEDVGESLASIYLKRLDQFIAMHPDYEDFDIPNIPRFSSFIYRRSHTSIPEVRASRFHLTQTIGSRWQPVMKFTSPIAKYAILPGELYYLRIRRPGQDIPMQARMYLPHQGHTLVTNKSGNHFHLHLNVLHVIEGITCLSRDPISAEILIQLYGKHEAIYNKLLMRYKMDEIDDLFSYFQQPWMSAMYQETFTQLIDNINYQEVGAIYEDMRNKYGGVDVHVEEPARTSRSFSFMSCELESCEEEQAKRLARFRSVIDRYVVRTSSQMDHEVPVEVESECGLSPAMKSDIGNFWETLGAERIIFQHIARHLEKHNITNQHYAKADTNFYDVTKKNN